MDFLTQPLAPSAPLAPTGASTSTPATHSRSADASSVLTTSTTATSDLHHDSNAAFAHLRSASLPSEGLPGERHVDLPSTKSGDWRAYGRVQGHVIFWDDGVVSEKRKMKEDAIKEAWQVEGTLWFTKRAETLLVLDRAVPPEQVSRATPKIARRLSFGRRRSISPSSTRSAEAGSATQPTVPADTAVDTKQPTDDTSSGGFFKKVLQAVRPGRKERRGSSGSDDRSLSRSRSRPEVASSTADPGTTSHTATGAARVDEAPGPVAGLTGQTQRLTFEEPATVHASPFPQYRGHTVTALSIASPSRIQSVRFYPQRNQGASSTSSDSSPFSFFAFSKDEQPISSPFASPSSASPSGGVRSGSVQIQPPVVELDVFAPSGVGETTDEGRNREVTVGFVFKEILCASEANDFHALVEAALATPADVDAAVPIHRTVSRSLEGTGTGSQRRKSWAFPG